MTNENNSSNWSEAGISQNAVKYRRNIVALSERCLPIAVLPGNIPSRIEKMKDLQWKDEYSLGIPAVDLQHKRIFDCFISIAAEGLAKNNSWHAYSSTVQLVKLIQEHFALEESVMRKLGYADTELERHVEEHRRYHEEMRDLAQNSLRIKGSLTHEKIKTAQKWFREHILSSDKHYVTFFGPAPIALAQS
jgi:hemerythrin